METTNRPQTIPTPASTPFFSLLAEAEAIQIREVSSEQDTFRSFVVKVKSPSLREPMPPIPPESEAPVHSHAHLLDCAALLLKSQDTLLARNIYSFLLKQNIKDASALKGLGICFYRLVDMTSAKKCFRALTELYATADGYMWLALTYLGEKNEKAALAAFCRIQDPAAITDLEERFLYFKEFGNSLLRHGEVAPAEECYRRALDLGISSDVICVNLGTLEIQKKNIDKARNHFAAAIKANPSNSKAHCGLGLCAMEANEEKTAVACFKRALDVDSQNLIALTQIVHLSTKYGGETNAQEYLKTFLKMDPKNIEVRYSLAAVQFKQGDWRSADRELDTVLSRDPGHRHATLLKEELIRNRHQF